ncbi:hypothetical protein FHR36_006100 [Kitasatospora paracochleata]|uniref:Uncharacterized protein n=1 Tax=Kitasatospora paracochleata TaxID=58354 RepID=A0ABT1J6R8_9ACTN|nr:hypothetical protein [Kitasatospora paracochleata]
MMRLSVFSRRRETYGATQVQEFVIGCAPISLMKLSVPSAGGGFCLLASSGAQTSQYRVRLWYGAMPATWVSVLMGPLTESGYSPSLCFGVYKVWKVCLIELIAVSDRFS